MKCTKCESAIDKKDKYCSNCGSKITKENKFLKFIKENSHTIVQILIIIMLCFILGLIVIKKTDPETIAKKYMEAVLNNDTEEIYNTFDLENSDFVSLDILNDKITKLENVSNISLINKKVYENEALITYKYDVGSKTYIASVSLTKSGKKFFIFDNWKVNSGKIAKNITIEVPKGAKVWVDNVSLDKYLNSDNTNEFTDEYVIDNMIVGSYTFKASLLDGNEIEKELNVIDNGNYSIGSVELNDETKNKVTELAKTTIQDIYNNLISGTTYSSLNYNDNIKMMYRNLKYNYANSNLVLNKLEITDIILEASSLNNGKLVSTFEIEYNYDINYKSLDLDNNYSGTSRSFVSIEFTYDNEYKINNIGNLNLNFWVRK